MPDAIDQYFASQSPAPAPAGDAVDQYFKQQSPPVLEGDKPQNAGLVAQAKQNAAALQQPDSGVLHNLTAGTLQNFAGTAAGLEQFGQLASHVAGWQGGEDAFSRMVAKTQGYQPDQGSIAGTAGGILGGIPGALAGPAGLANSITNSGLQAADTADAAQRAGKIGYGQEAVDIIGQTGLAAITAKLGQANLTGKLLKSSMPEIQAGAMAMAKRLAASGVIDGSMNTLNGVVNAAIQKYTGITPDADVTEGASTNFLAGAAQGVVGRGVHEALGQQQLPAEPSPKGGDAIDDYFKNATFQAPGGEPMPEGQRTPAEGPAIKVEPRTPAEAEPGAEPDVNTRATTPEEQAGDADTDARIKAGMAQPDAPTPQRRAGDREFTPDEDRELLKQVFNDKDQENPAFGRRAQDWKYLSDNNKSLLSELRERQIAKEAGEEPKPLPTGLTANPDIQGQAAEYMKQAGIDYKPNSDYVKVNPEKASQIASAYDAMEHNPSDPAVKKSYDAFKSETLDQYNYLKDKGVKFSFTDQNPYPDSKSMAKDISDNNSLKVFSGGTMPEDHPLAQMIPGEAGVSYNDAFRAVHDYFGHAKEGYGFGPRGEENAWRQHSQMYSPEARGAMTAETRGQNSWVNFGPKGEENRANPASTTYAEQKAGLLPAEHTQIAPKRTVASESPRGAVPVPAVNLDGTAVAFKQVADKLKGAWETGNAQLGTGLGLNETQKGTKLDITQSSGELARQNAILEQAMKPSRDVFEKDNIKTDNAAGAQWIDHAEATGQSLHPDPEIQKMLDFRNALNADSIKRATKLGLTSDIVGPDGHTTSKWSADYIGRLFKFPEAEDTATSATGGNKTLQGPGTFRIARDYDTYSDALAAAKAQGGKPLFENPADMILAKDVEVSRFIKAKELLRAKEDQNVMPWVADDQPKPKTLQSIKDRSGQDTRELIMPKWQVGKFAGMQSFEGNSYLDEQRKAGRAIPLRSGDPVPDGYARTGRKINGTMFADPTTAHLFDSQISVAPPKSAVQYVSGLANTISGLQYMGGISHAGLVLTGAIGQGTGLSIDNALHGEFSLAAKNAARLVDPRFAMKVKAQLSDPTAHPELEDIAQRVAMANPDVYKKSVIATHHTFDQAKEKWEAGNPIGAAGDMIQATAGLIHDQYLKPLVQIAKIGNLAARAETDIARGVPAAEGRGSMAQSRATGDNVMGFANSKPYFQNETYKAVRNLIMSAGQYAEGAPRVAIGSLGDTVGQIAKVFKGDKSVALTPRMQAVIGAFVATAATSALTQIAATKLNTGSAIMPTGTDWLHPRTGNKDAKGNDERVTMPGLAASLEELIENPGAYAYNRFSPVIRGTTEDIQNKDYANRQIYGGNDSTAEKVGKGLLHTGSEILPRAIGTNSLPDDAYSKQVLNRGLGLRFSHPISSDAEATALSLIHERSGSPSDTQASKEATINKLADGVRTHSPTSVDDINGAIKNGTITFKDRLTIMKRAQETGGLVGSIKSDKLEPEDVMTIWSKATPQERSLPLFSSEVRKRIAGADMPQDWKQVHIQQINKDIQEARQ